MPNREEAYARRGAPWTFDVDGIVEFVNVLHESAQLSATKREPTYAPSFDHAVEDPIEDDIVISPEASVVTLEGNYLLLDDEKWSDISDSLDLKIFVDVDVKAARDRVAKRHVLARIEPTLEKGQERFDGNDAINGDLVRTRIVSVDITVDSVPM